MTESKVIEKINFLGDRYPGGSGILVWYDGPLVYIATIDNDPQKYLFKEHEYFHRTETQNGMYRTESFACQISDTHAQELIDGDWHYKQWPEIAKDSEQILFIVEDEKEISSSEVTFEKMMQMESQDRNSMV